MPAKWKKFTKEELQQFVKDSISYASFAEKMGYSSTGGSGSKTAKEVIDYYHFDTSHFLGQGHNKGKFDYDRFKYGNAIKASNMLNALTDLRGHKCEKCKNEKWLDAPIPLEVHHKDGDHLNNELENLELLCPNCHAMTKNWRGKNINTKKEVITEEKFVEVLQNSKSVRQALMLLGLTGAGGNYTRAYNLINKYEIKHLMK